MRPLLVLCYTVTILSCVYGDGNKSDDDDDEEGRNGDPIELKCRVGWPLMSCGPHAVCTLIYGQYECLIRQPPGLCFFPKKTGRCRAFFPRYYYNSKTEQCEQFIYGGCGANRNNFKTLEQCKDACMLPSTLALDTSTL